MLKNLIVGTGVFASVFCSAGTVSNDMLKLTYSDREGNILFIDSKLLDKPLNVIQSFKIYVHPEGNNEGKWIPFSQFKLLELSKDDSQSTLRCEYAAAVLDGEIRVVTTTRIIKSAIISEISVANNTKTPILRVRHPALRRLQFTEDGRHDELLWPQHTTRLVKDPRNNLLPPQIYPGHAGINMLALSGNSSGIAIIGTSKLIATQYWFNKSDSGDGIMMGLDILDNIKPGIKTDYSCTIYIYQGDWRSAGDYYREWFYDNFPKPDYPDWIKYSNGYLGILWGSTEYPNYDVGVGEHINSAWRLGLDHIQYWGQTGKHACPGYPLADPMRGGEDALARMFSEVINAGFATGAYFWGCGIGKYEVLASKFRGVRWTEYPEELRPPSWEWVKRHSRHKVSRQEPTKDLTGAPGWKSSGAESIADAEARRLNPQVLHELVFHSAGFQNWLNFWIDRYVENFKIQVPYLDVYGFRPREVEYNPYLNMWGDGTEGIYRYQFLERLNDRFKGKVKGFTPMIEGLTDCYNVQAPALVSGFRRFIEAYRYIFPELIVYNGMHNGNWWSEKSLDSISYSYLDGTRFDLIWKWISEDISRVVWLRDSLMPLVADAKYMFDGGIESSSQDIEVTYMDAVDKLGLALINIRNYKKVKDAEIILPNSIADNFSRAFILPLYGDFMSIEMNKSIQVPEQTVTSVILISTKKPASLPGVGFVFPEQTPEGMIYDVRTLNFTSEKIPMRVNMRNIALASDEIFSFDATPFGADARTIKIDGNKQYKTTQRLVFNFNIAGFPELRRTYEPYFSNADFELETGLPLSNQTAFEGHSALKIAPGQRIQPFLYLAPKRKATISVYTKIEEGGKAEALVYNHRQRKTLGRLVFVPGEDKKDWRLMRCTFENTEDSMIQISFNNVGTDGNVYFDKVEVIQD